MRGVSCGGGEVEVSGIVGGYAFNAPCGADKQEVKTIVYSHVRMVLADCPAVSFRFVYLHK